MLAARAATTLLATAMVASAHRPLTTAPGCGDDWGSSSQSVPVPDPSISWAFQHYLDCSRTAVWMAFKNPKPGFAFYVGVSTPTLERFKDLRADALIIGPGLPQLTAQEEALLPAPVRDDGAYANRAAGVGAVLRRSPQDQTTCAHLGPTMTRNSKVVNNRCDFFEPYGSTHSWRLLDADDNIIPGPAGSTYHVAVFLQAHTSGKIGIALGTWVENFRKPFTLAAPSCARLLPDFSEKASNQSSCLPVSACGAVPIPLTKACAKAGAVLTPTCPVLTAAPDDGKATGMAMSCGGAGCRGAAKLWDAAGMKMHKGMAIRFTGDVALDFVRGMIPHHQGAVDMCATLLGPLWCSVQQSNSSLGLEDGMEQFCWHVRHEQEKELAGMRAWLGQRGAAEAAAACGSAAHAGHGGDGAGSGSGCGNTSAVSSKRFIHANNEMHGAMAVKLGCQHSVDFVRSMIPHHAGAVVMCDILTETMAATRTQDTYLTALCADITRAQRAEIAFMHQWLDGRGMAVSATCQDCGAQTPTQPQPPCEDMLPTSSFCHMLGGDLNCNCAATLEEHPCGTPAVIKGFGVLDVDAECQRTCGKCPASRPPLFHVPCARGNATTTTAAGGMAHAEGGGHGTAHGETATSTPAHTGVGHSGDTSTGAGAGTDNGNNGANGTVLGVPAGATSTPCGPGSARGKRTIALASVVLTAALLC